MTIFTVGVNRGLHKCPTAIQNIRFRGKFEYFHNNINNRNLRLGSGYNGAISADIRIFFTII